MQKVTLVAAMQASDRGIGFQGQLPWSLPEDLAHFKKVTMGQKCIVGYNTYMGLPVLKGRELIVAPRKAARRRKDGIVVNTMEEQIEAIDGDVVVIGGSEIYRRAMPFATHMWLTFVQRLALVDAYFPKIDWREWKVLEDVYPADKHLHMIHFERAKT